MELPTCVLVRDSQIKETLKTPSAQGKHLLEPLKAFSAGNKLPLNILEDKEVSNEAEVHRHEGDLWLCLEGEATFIYGGEMVRPWAKKLPDGVDDREIKANEIKKGAESVLKPGDWLWIPPGQPNQHKTEGTARLVIIKIPAKELVPLVDVPGWKKNH